MKQASKFFCNTNLKLVLVVELTGLNKLRTDIIASQKSLMCKFNVIYVYYAALFMLLSIVY